MDTRIRDYLVAEGRKLLDAKPVFTEYVGIDAADRLVNDLENHPHAFVIACILDRQMRAEVAWKVPYSLQQRLGTFDFEHLKTLAEADLVKAMKFPTVLHRFPDKMGAIVYAAIQHIDHVYGGVASAIWADSPSSAEVIFRFLQFQGVGPKIATMAANILARDFKVPMSDHYSIDISVDVQVRRVFPRLGLVSQNPKDEEIIYRARALSPEFPGLLDLPCWEIGSRWCRPKSPNCGACPMGDLCPAARPVNR